MALYTKYRPRDWDSVVSQDYITTILRNSLISDRVGHAYLFHGSRGTGKTTSARILAKGVNCLELKNGNPCHECENCHAFDNGTMLDCIEIDGASNNGIENVRELIEKARFEPNQGKYKIYIIDEVHMLSTGAFNALLKTLEEPPTHVKFILATTEIDKVPETIRSRTLRFDFRKITQEDIIARLQFVCKEENITAEKEAIELIARVARGGLRDALTLLEQNTIDNEVRAIHIRHTLALVEDALIDTIIETMRLSDIERIHEILMTLRTGHIDARGLMEQILYRLRDILFRELQSPLYPIYQEIFDLMMEGHSKLRSIPDGMMLVEITFLKIVKRGVLGEYQKTVGGSGQSKKEHEGRVPEGKGNRLSSEQQHTGGTDPSGSSGTTLTPDAIDRAGDREDHASTKTSTSHPELPHEKGEVEESVKIQGQKKILNKPFSFPEFIHHFREQQPALMTDLKSARFQIRDSTGLQLIFTKAWNHGRVNTPKVKNLLTGALAEIFGGDWSIECILEEDTRISIEHVDALF